MTNLDGISSAADTIKPDRPEKEEEENNNDDDDKGFQKKVDIRDKSGENTTEDNPDNAAADDEILELSKLRCTSLQTEELSQRQREKEKRRGRTRRCADYPGLEISNMFGSDTMMKLAVIKNELHNIKGQQLRRVDGEVAAMAARVRAVDENLEKSEKFIKTATAALAEAVRYQTEHSKEEGEEENALTRFDAQMKLLEGKLMQAKSLAKESCDD